MDDAKLSRRKVKTFLKQLHAQQRNLGVEKTREHLVEPLAPIEEKIHELKQQALVFPVQDENVKKVHGLLAQLAVKLEQRETKLERIQASLHDVRSVIDRLVLYEEEEKKAKLTARQRQLHAIEEQLQVFEHRLMDAAKRYKDESLYPLRKRIEELKEKYQLLLAKESPAEEARKEEETIAEEVKKELEQMVLPPAPSEEEQRITEEVEKLKEEIAAQEVKLELPDFILPEEEELSLPSPFPELEMVAEEEIMPPSPKKKSSLIDNMLGEVKRLLSRA